MATATLRNPKDFITCPDTGQNLNKPAIGLVKANIFTAVVFLLAGGALGLLVALTRWPAVHLLPSELFYIALTALGTVMVLIGQATVMFSAYPPLKAHPLFYVGVVLFAVGALLPCFIYIATLIKAKNERTYEGSMPLATFGGLVWAIIAIFTWVMGAVIMLPTMLWSMGLISHIDAQMYRVVFWALAHSTQQMMDRAELQGDQIQHKGHAAYFLIERPGAK